MKKFLLSLLILVTGISAAQESTFKKQWQKIDSLELQGQVSSASKLVRDLIDQAKEQNNYPDLIRAKIYYYKFYQINQENSNAFILADINKTLSRLPVPYVNVLLSYKADFLKQYYDQHRWRIDERKKTEDPNPTDLETWSAETLRDSIRISYDHSLEDGKKLMETPTKTIEELLLESPLGRKYRPSLFDLLAYRALEYYSDPSNFPKLRPEKEYPFTSEALYADTEDFLQLYFSPRPPTSAWTVLQTYQQLERRHRQQQDTTSRVYAQLERLEYVNAHFRGEGKWGLYADALEQLKERHEGKPIVALILLRQAQILRERANERDEEEQLLHPEFLQQAVALCDRIIEEFPNSDSYQNALNLKAAITSPMVDAMIPDILASQQAGRLYVSYRNLDSLRLRVIRVPASHELHISYRGRDSIVAGILQRETIIDRILELPASQDHNRHSTEFVLESLDLGTYFVHISGREPGKDYSYGFLQVSDLIFSESQFPSYSLYRTLDRTSGEPVSGVRMQFFNYRGNRIANALTNADGLLKRKIDRNSSTEKVLLIKGQDSLSSRHQYYGWRSYREAQQGPEAKAMIYVDRHIYRPGQTIYFKGVLLKREKEKTSTVPGEFMEMVAQDPNGEEVFRKRIKTNEYGSFSGEFDLPKSGLTGRFQLHAEDPDADSPFWDLILDDGDFKGGSVQFDVEEYKRPTFEVTFEENDRIFRFGDTIKIEGQVKAFMGAPINDSRLVYEVTRQKMIYSWWGRRTEEAVTIKVDSLTTDEQGNFMLAFPAEISRPDQEDEDLIYDYTVKATVTSISGETRVGSKSLKIGKKNLLLDMELPETLSPGDSLDIRLKATNLDEQPLPVSGSLKIYKLAGPDRILQERLWEAPEIQQIPEEQFLQLYPEEPYGPTLPPEEWPRGELVFETSFTDSVSYNTSIRIPEDWRSGKYLVEVKAGNGNSSSEIRRSFELRHPRDLYLPDNQRFHASLLNSNYREDGRIELLLQTAYRDLNMQVSVFDGYTNVLDTFVNIDGRAEFVIPLKESYGRKFQIQLYGVKNNSALEKRIDVELSVPEKNLQIKTNTFRNKIQPGVEETWSFKVTDPDGSLPDAEVLASMYDASLDQFKRPYYPSDWRTDPSFGDPNVQFPDFLIEAIRSARHLANEFARPVEYNEYHDLFDQLVSFGFDFGTSNSWVYRRYLETLKIQGKTEELAGDTRGRITDENGLPLAGVNVIIRGTSRGTQTTRQGEFGLDTEKGDILVFSYLGFKTVESVVGEKKEFFVVLEEDRNALEEKVVVGYELVEVEQDMVEVANVPPPPPAPEAMLLTGNVAGVEVQTTAMGQREFLIRGQASGTANSPLYIIDGVEVSEAQLSGDSILSTEILEPAEAMAIYGARAAHGAIIITTTKSLQELQQVEARKDLKETAFFFPHLTLDEEGQVQFSFTSPEALTQWKVRLLAHTKSWRTGTYEGKVMTQKELSIQPNAPRFLREGDSIVFMAKVTNMSEETMTGSAMLQLFDAVRMEPIDNTLLLDGNMKAFNLPANGSTGVSWNLFIPEGVQAVTYRLVARAGNFTDGEENLLPVLSNRMLVTESLPLFVRAGETETFEFENLRENSSNSLKHHKFTLEYTANPAWYAIQSLPYLMEFPYECSEQIFARIYANSLGAHVMNSHPKIRAVFETWRRDSSLVSQLERNEELKSLILTETPWLRDAVSDEEQKQRLGELFKMEQLAPGLKENLHRLKAMQNPSGGFPWFSGGPDNYFITRHIVAGFGHLKALGVEASSEAILKKAIAYMDAELLDRLEKAEDSIFYNSISGLHYLYSRSFHEEAFPPEKENRKIIDHILKVQKEKWLQRSLYEKGLLMLVLTRAGEENRAREIMKSLEESAVRSEEQGMYWKENQSGWYWYRAPVETQALLIEAFAELGNRKAVEEMKIWLLQNKRTNHWPTTKATTEAVYALLMQGEDWLQLEDRTEIEVGGEALTSEKLLQKEKEAGTGYLKLNWKGDEISKSFSQIRITNRNIVPGYGGAYWQYFEELDKIKAHAESPLNVEKELYLNVSKGSGTVLEHINPGTKVKPGDLVTVRLLVRVTADMDYIHLKDMRASGFEPTGVLSGYKYQDGTAYYESTRDAATHFFFDQLRKGTYVLEYTVRANNSGSFSNGITTIESMYAPEFSGHTKGVRVKIGE